MKFKRTFFGGYKKSEVDLLVQKLEGNEELYKSRINILESEIKLLKDSSEKEINEYRLIVSGKDKALNESQNRVETLEAKINFLKDEAESQKQSNIQLSRTISENRNVVNLYEAEIIRLGRLYLDALDYSERIKSEAKENSAAVVNNIFSEILKTESEYSEFINYINTNRKMIEDMTEKIETSVSDIRKYLRESENGISNIGKIYMRLEDEKNSLIRKIQKDDNFKAHKLENFKEPSDIRLKDTSENVYKDLKQENSSEPFGNYTQDSKTEDYKESVGNSYPDSIPDIYSEQEKTEPEVEESKEDDSENKGDYSRYFDEIEKKYADDRIAKPSPKPSIRDILEKYSNMN